MDAISNEQNIIFIDNILSNEELDTIYEFCNSGIQWKSNSYDGSVDKCAIVPHDNENVSGPLNRATDEIMNRIEHRFGRKLSKQFPSIRKWEIGDYQPMHADGEDLNGLPNEAYPVDYASVIYLNDNFDGGEIYFPLQEIKYKPLRGTAVFFPANRFFQHSVLPITSGIRYTSPQFWIPEKHKILREFYANH